MKIKEISSENLRNLHTFCHDINNPTVILVGSNAEGKTSFLEAIYLLALTKSFRGSAMKNLINFQAEKTIVRGVISNDTASNDRVLKILFQKTARNVKKTYYLDGKQVPHKEFMGNFFCVLFVPEDLQFIFGSPSRRRREIDFLLQQLSPTYTNNLTSYTRLIQQRRKVLQEIRNNYLSEGELAVWDQQIATIAPQLISARQDLILNIKDILADSYTHIADHQSILSLTYRPSFVCTSSDEYLLKLTEMRRHDLRVGNTSFGPHRDDFLFLLNQKDLALYGSRGEQRSSILSFKKAQIDYIKKIKNITPVLLLDDVLSELDEYRRNQLLTMYQDMQVIITTTDRDFFKHITGQQIITIENGTINEVATMTIP